MKSLRERRRKTALDLDGPAPGEIHLVQSDASPSGARRDRHAADRTRRGECVFAAMGKRVRQLPITPELLG